MTKCGVNISYQLSHTMKIIKIYSIFKQYKSNMTNFKTCIITAITEPIFSSDIHISLENTQLLSRIARIS